MISYMRSLVAPINLMSILALALTLSACVPAPPEGRFQGGQREQGPAQGQAGVDGAGAEVEPAGERAGESTGGESIGGESIGGEMGGVTGELGGDLNSMSCEVAEDEEREWTGVITEIKFGREEPPGVSLGTNIDGRVSQSDDAESCFRADLSSPEGAEGIDNQFSKILPLVEAVGGEAIEGLVQGIINQGRLLLMFELLALDDPLLEADDCLQFNFFYGLGTPQVSAEGVIISGQTFDRDAERPSLSIEGVTLNERTFEVAGLEFQLPIEVFDQSYILDLSRVTIHGTFDSEGELSGYLSGAIDVDAVAARIEEIEGGGMVAALVPGFLRQQADLDPDEEGVCHGLSVTLTFKSKRAHLFKD